MGFFNFLFHAGLIVGLLAFLAFILQIVAVLASGDPQWPAQQYLRRTVIIGGVGVVVAIIAAIIVVLGFLVGFFNDPVGALGDLMESLGVVDEPEPDGGPGL